MLSRLFIFLCVLCFSTFSAANQNTLESFENQIKNYKGKVVYVDFWASWCVPCRQSFPWLNEMQAKHSKGDFTVLSVNLDAKKANAKEFLLETPAQFPVIYDPKGKISKAFKLKGMPSSFIINKAGKIVSSHVGFTNEKKELFQQEIEHLISQ